VKKSPVRSLIPDAESIQRVLDAQRSVAEFHQSPQGRLLLALRIDEIFEDVARRGSFIIDVDPENMTCH
jgi:hypothetical protein